MIPYRIARSEVSMGELPAISRPITQRIPRRAASLEEVGAGRRQLARRGVARRGRLEARSAASPREPASSLRRLQERALELRDN